MAAENFLNSLEGGHPTPTVGIGSDHTITVKWVNRDRDAVIDFSLADGITAVGKIGDFHWHNSFALYQPVSSGVIDAIKYVWAAPNAPVPVLPNASRLDKG